MKKTKGTDPEAVIRNGQNGDVQAGSDASPDMPGGKPAADQPELTGGEPAAEQAPDPCQELKSALEAKERDFNALSDKYLRLAAEYDNFRKRSQKEKEALYADSIALVVKEMLPVFDNLDRAGQAAVQYDHEGVRKIAEGIAMIQKQAAQALEHLGVSTIECVGQTFDPTQHEAVMHIEDESVGTSIVVDELQKGYRREDRIIRHSMVKVAN